MFWRSKPALLNLLTVVPGLRKVSECPASKTGPGISPGVCLSFLHGKQASDNDPNCKASPSTIKISHIRGEQDVVQMTPNRVKKKEHLGWPWAFIFLLLRSLFGPAERNFPSLSFCLNCYMLHMHYTGAENNLFFSLGNCHPKNIMVRSDLEKSRELKCSEDGQLSPVQTAHAMVQWHQNC